MSHWKSVNHLSKILTLYKMLITNREPPQQAIGEFFPKFIPIIALFHEFIGLLQKETV